MCFAHTARAEEQRDDVVLDEPQRRKPEIIDSTGGALWIKREAVAAYAPVAQRGLSVPAEAIEPLESAFACFLLARHWIIEADGLRTQAERYSVPELPG